MPVLVLLLAVAFAASPFWVPGFGGFNADQFPVPQIDPPVQPEGYAFAIWGVIYLWLIVGSGFAVWKRRGDPAWVSMRPPLALSLAVGAVWLPVAVRSPVWATVLIWVMLVTAIWALWRAPRTDAWAAAWPVGLYAGWLSAASCVAVGLLLAGYGVTGQLAAAWIMISAASVLAWAVQWALGHAPTYGIAVIWALFAVTVQNSFAGVGLFALAGAAFLLAPTVRAARGK
ncbi:MAG: tryptophan-rich sensory protein [Pseudomonadota bacterium]